MSNFFDPSHGLSDLLHNLEQTLDVPSQPTAHPDHTSATPDLLIDTNSGLGQGNEDGISDHLQAPHLSFLEGHHESMVMQSAHANCSNTPYITVNSSGWIDLHKINGDTVCVGQYLNGAFWNNSGQSIGYLSDGVVYDYFDHRQGAFHGGCIFNRKGVEIGHADTGVEAAAYILYVERGGIQ